MRLSFKVAVGVLLVVGAMSAVLAPTPAHAAKEYKAYSKADQVKALYLKLENYPHPASPTGPNNSYVNWPLRSQGCPAADRGTTLYKSVPWMALISFVRGYDYYGVGNQDYYRGDNLTLSGNCRDRFNDAGPGSYGVNSANPGVWVSTTAYLNWAGNQGVGPSWSNAILNDANNSRLTPDQVPPGADPLWGMKGNDNTQKDQILFPRNGVTSYTPTSFRLYSNGSTLFRHEFTLTQEDIDKINLSTASVEIDIKADDWYKVYINGTAQLETIITSERKDMKFSNKNAFVVGKNVLAVQVIDKAVWYQNPITEFNRASGLAYALYINIPDTAYELVPTISGDPDRSEGAEPVTLQPSVQNNGSITAPNIDWQITKFVLPPGAAIPGQAENPQTPQGYYGNGAQPIRTGTGNMNSGANPISIEQQILGEHQVGERVCFALSVKPFTATPPPNRWRHGVPFCVTISKQPKVQVWGGDLIVGKRSTSDIRTSTTRKMTSIVQPPAYNSNMVQGLYPTGVSDVKNASGNWQKLPAGSNDPHWTLTAITRSPDAASQSHCQLNALPQRAKVVDLSKVTVGGNDAWNANPSDSSWIAAYTDAENDGVGTSSPGACQYPGNSGPTTDPNVFKKAATWTFKLTNDFTVGGCVDPKSIQLRMKFSADDEAQIVVNGQVITEFGEFKKHGEWPKDPIAYTTNKHPSAFKVGSNTLEIRVKSGWGYTGLLVGGDFAAIGECSSEPTTTTFGSWGEYGVSASGSITGMASGAGFSAGTINEAFCSVSLLTFTNAGNDVCTNSSPKGSYSNSRTLPAIETKFTATNSLGTNPTVNVANLNSGVYSASGTVNISTGGPGDITIPKGKWVVINARNADVVINNNIRYSGDALQGLADIPQLVIIANNIRIAGGVNQVDSWLMATGDSGNLTTCANVAAADLRANGTCSGFLRVNGPVAARHLYLYRTAGSTTGAGNTAAAEVFNLRPDAYLWATWYNSSAGRLQTVRTTELPPRF